MTSLSLQLLAQARLSTPLGAMTAARNSAGLAGLWFDDQRHHPGALAAPHKDSDPLFSAVQQWLDDYFNGQVRPLDAEIVCAPQGTPFQLAVWQLLRQIGPGQTQSYGVLAHHLGHAQAVRAVGAAVGRNPISILIPCHRVVGASGHLTGYAGGLHRKRALLTLEGVLA